MSHGRAPFDPPRSTSSIDLVQAQQHKQSKKLRDLCTEIENAQINNDHQIAMGLQNANAPHAAAASSSSPFSLPSTSARDPKFEKAILTHLKALTDLCLATNPNFQKSIQVIIRAMLFHRGQPVSLAMQVMQFRITHKGCRTGEDGAKINSTLTELANAIIAYLRDRSDRAKALLENVKRRLKSAEAPLQVDLALAKLSLVSPTKSKSSEESKSDDDDESDTEEEGNASNQESLLLESYLFSQETIVQAIELLTTVIDTLSEDGASAIKPVNTKK